MKENFILSARFYAPWRLRDCKNRDCYVSWPEVVIGIPSHGVDCFVSWGSFNVSSLCFECAWCFVSWFLVVSTSAIDCLERLVSKMTCYVSSGTLNLHTSVTMTASHQLDIRNPHELALVSLCLVCLNKLVVICMCCLSYLCYNFLVVCYCVLVPVKWFAGKIVSEMTCNVSSGTLNPILFIGLSNGIMLESWPSGAQLLCTAQNQTEPDNQGIYHLSAQPGWVGITIGKWARL